MSVLAHTPPPGRARHLVNALIAALVLASLFIPASYYTGGDTYDERFAWRMFSGKRAERCAVQVLETRRVGDTRKRTTLGLTQIIHKAWESGLKRLRPDVVGRFFDTRCGDPQVQALTLIRRCRRADGAPKPNDELTHSCPMRLVLP